MPKLILKGTKVYLTSELRKELGEKFGRLDKLARILDVRAELERGQSRKEGKPFRFEINLRVPGAFLRSEAWGRNISEAVNLAIDEIRGSLLRFKERRGEGE